MNRAAALTTKLYLLEREREHAYARLARAEKERNEARKEVNALDFDISAVAFELEQEGQRV